MRRLSLLLFFAMIGGCSRCGSNETAFDAGPKPAPSSAVVTVDASAGTLDDLLHFTDARLGVSSKVQNPHDFAEHIADGKLDTAWNGKTGDLVGGWIGFRVPQEARVRLIEITVGYVAKSKKGEDLFDMNHRISKVRLSRDGVAIKEHELDPDSRTFQKIPLDQPGGDFKIEVLAVKPGSKKEWRELVVSEIKVFGIAGPAKRADPSVPRVMVGGFDAPPPTGVPAPKRVHSAPAAFASASEICEKWLAPLKDKYAQYMDGGVNPSGLPWEPPEPSCSFSEETENNVGLVTFSHSDLEAAFGDIGVTYGGKTYALGEHFAYRSHFDPGCTGYGGGSVADRKVVAGDPPKAIFQIYSFEVANPFPRVLEDGGLGEGASGYRLMTMHEVTCTLAPSGPTCTKKEIASKRGDYQDSSVATKTAPPLPWK